MSKYASFSELAEHEAFGKDYGVRLIDRADTEVVVIAPHGGLIEAGTSEIAALIAGVQYSLFCFEGLKKDGKNRDLHITSHRFDHPDCVALTTRCSRVVTVHGCMGHERIYIGGLDTELAYELSMELRAGGFLVQHEGHKYPGRHPSNICNRGLNKKGAQLEITHDLRSPQHHCAIASAARAAIARLPAFAVT